MRYTLSITGHTIRGSIDIPVSTIREAKRIVEEYGDQADSADLYRGDDVVALFQRDRNGNGRRWYRAQA